MSNPLRTRSTSTIQSSKINLTTKNGKQRGTSNITTTGQRRTTNANRFSNSVKSRNLTAERSFSSGRTQSKNSTLKGVAQNKENDSGSSARESTIDVPEITTTFLDDTYHEVLDKFNRLRNLMSSSQHKTDSSLIQNEEINSSDCIGGNQRVCECPRGTEKITTTKIGGTTCDYIQETIIERSMLVGKGIQTTSRHIIKRCDKNGHIEVEVKESKHVCGEEQAAITKPDYFGEISEAMPQHKNTVAKSQNATNNEHLKQKSYQRLVDVNMPAYRSINSDRFSVASDSSATATTSVKVTSSFTKMRPTAKNSSIFLKHTVRSQKMPTASRASPSGGRSRYQIENKESLNNHSVPSLAPSTASSTHIPSNFVKACHKPLECCRCICDVCSSHIAQQLFLDQLDQQTLNELVNQRDEEGRQKVDYFRVGEILNKTTGNWKRRRSQYDDCILPPHCTMQQRDIAPQHTRALFHDRQPLTSTMLPSAEGLRTRNYVTQPNNHSSTGALLRSPYANEQFEDISPPPYYGGTSHIPPTRLYRENEVKNGAEPMYYSTSDAIAARQFYQRTPRYSERLENENVLNVPHNYRSAPREQLYPIERIDEISAPSYHSITSFDESASRYQNISQPKTSFYAPPRSSYQLHDQTSYLSVAPQNVVSRERREQVSDGSTPARKIFSRYSAIQPADYKKASSGAQYASRPTEKDETLLNKGISDISVPSNENIAAISRESENISDILTPGNQSLNSDSSNSSANRVDHNKASRRSISKRCSHVDDHGSQEMTFHIREVENSPAEYIAEIESTAEITAHHSTATIISARTVDSKLIAEILIPNEFDCKLLVEPEDAIESNQREELAAQMHIEIPKKLVNEVVFTTSVQSLKNFDNDVIVVSSEVQLRQRQKSIKFQGDSLNTQKGNQSEPLMPDDVKQISAKKIDEVTPLVQPDKPIQQTDIRVSELIQQRQTAEEDIFSRQRELSNSVMRNSNFRSTNNAKTSNRVQKSGTQRRNSKDKRRSSTPKKQVSRIPRPVQAHPSNQARPSNQQKPCFSQPRPSVCCDCIPICPFCVDPCCPRPPICRRK